MTSCRRIVPALALCGALSFLSPAARAESGPLSLHLRGGAGVFVDKPQSDQFGPGFELTLGGEYAFVPQLGVEVLVGYDRFGGQNGLSDGSEVRVGGGVRIRPWNDDAGYLIHAGKRGGHRGNLLGNLWLAIDAEYVATGGRDRFGLEASVGFMLSLVDYLQLGPYLSYHHVFQPDNGMDPNSAKLLFVGLAFTLTDGAVHIGDRDNDGVPDKDDACPDTPETKNGFHDEDGCPDEVPAAPPPPKKVEAPKPDAPTAEIKEGKIETSDRRVFFDVDSDAIREEMVPAIDVVAVLLLVHPEIQKLRIEGNADSTGDPEHNRKLSLRRARSVMERLIEQGVSSDRLEAVGFGSSRPLDKDNSVEARARNRRVEFVIVDGGSAQPE